MSSKKKKGGKKKKAGGDGGAAKVGTRVIVQKKIGTIAFIGNTKFAEGKWVGVALDDPKGKNDGSVSGERYFTCDPKHGLFVRQAVVKPYKGKDKKGKKGKAAAAKEPEKKPAKSPSATKRKVERPTAVDNSGQVNTLKARIKQLEDTIDEEQKKVRKLDAENDTLKEQVKEAKKAASSAPAAAAPSASGGPDERDDKIKELEDKVEAIEMDLELEKEAGLDKDEELALKDEEITEYLTQIEELEAAAEDSLSALPPDQAQAGKLQAENNKLQGALQRLAEKYNEEKLEHDAFQSDVLAKREETQDAVEELANLKEENEELKETVAELQESLEDGGDHEQMVEDLTEQNMELDMEVSRLKDEIGFLKELKAANEEVEGQQQEDLTQFQAELDQKDIEIAEYGEQLKLKSLMNEELHSTNRKFKTHVAALEAEIQEMRFANVKDDGKDDGQQRNQDRRQKLQMQAQVGEVRSKSVKYMQALLSVDAAEQRIRFVERHIPDNLAIDKGCVELLVTLDRIQGKCVGVAKLLSEFYGITTHNDVIANFAYGLCDKMLDLAKTTSTLKKCIEDCTNEDTFQVAVDERHTLESPEQAIDDLLKEITEDSFNEEFVQDELDSAKENLVGYIAAHFMTDEDQQGGRKLKTEAAMTLELDVQKLYYQQCLVSTYFQSCADLFSLIPKPDGEENCFEEVFGQLKLMEAGNMELVDTMIKLAKTYQLVATGKILNPNKFKDAIDASSQSIFGCSVRIREIMEWVNNLYKRDAPEESKREYLSDQIEARLTTETNERRLLAILISTQSSLKELNQSLQDTPDDATRKELRATIWEEKANDCKMELTQSAAVKTTLEATTKKLEKAERALFLSQKSYQEANATVDVLKQKVSLEAGKSEKVDTLRRENEKLKRTLASHEKASDDIVHDMEKYQQKNKVLRQKVLKLKVELKSARGTGIYSSQMGEKMPTLSGKGMANLRMAVDEINMLLKTIKVLSGQLAQARTTKITRELNDTMPNLPTVWGASHVIPTSYNTGKRQAANNLKEVMPSPFFGTNAGDAQEVQTMVKSITDIGARVTKFRSQTTLVDISQKGKTTPGQQWLSQQACAQKIKDDTSDFKATLHSFLSSRRGNALRSLIANVNTPEDMVMGQSHGQLIGKLTVPDLTPTGNEKVTVTRFQLAQIHNVLVR